ncbi:MAG: hypothetical protein AAF610_09800 [Pseudomonadota bacterium]
MKVHRIALFASLIALFSACTLPETQRAQLIESVPVAERAYIVGKYTSDCDLNKKKTECTQPFSLVAVSYTNNADPEFEDRIAIERSQWTRKATTEVVTDFEGGKVTHFFCQAVVPGDYEFYGAWFYNYDGGGSGYTPQAGEKFSVPFSAKAGQLSVLDHIDVSVTSTKTLLGRRTGAPGAIAFSKMGDADLTNAVSKCPEAAQTLPKARQGLDSTATIYPFPNVYDGSSEAE